MSRLASRFMTAVAAMLCAAAAGAFALDAGQVKSVVVPGAEYGTAGFYWRPVQADSTLGVAALAAGAPAGDAGLRGGDKVVALNGKPVAEWDAEDLKEALAGSGPWAMEVVRGDDQELQVDVAGGKYLPPAVLYSRVLDGGVGYVRLDHMLEGSAVQLGQVLDGLRDGGATSVLLDLRGNSSGSIDEAIAVADLLLSAGKVLASTGREAARREYHSKSDDRTGGGALAVLVDGNTAGAAEIVAGAVQDWDRGILVGETTAGRSSVQTQVDVGGGISLRLTTAAYALPSGRYIDRRRRADSSLVEQEVEDFKTLGRGRQVQSHSGLVPDIRVEGEASTALFEQLQGVGDGGDRFFAYARVEGPLESYGDPAVDRFRSYATQAGFAYESSLERRLDQLKERATDQEKDRLADAISRLAKDVDKVEQRHWREAVPLLRRHLAFVDQVMHHGLGQALGNALEEDAQIQQGLGVLREKGAYQAAFAKERVGEAVADGDED